MSNRLIIELREDYLPRIKRKKVEFVKLLSKALEEKSYGDLDQKYGVTIMHNGDGHEKVVVNVDGEPVFRR
jgi:hypothetical protein